MKTFIFKKYSLKEIATLYEKTPKSFRTWIKPIEDEVGRKRGWDYDPGQIKTIVALLDVPPGYKLPDGLTRSDLLKK